MSAGAPSPSAGRTTAVCRRPCRRYLVDRLARGLVSGAGVPNAQCPTGSRDLGLCRGAPRARRWRRASARGKSDRSGHVSPDAGPFPAAAPHHTNHSARGQLPRRSLPGRDCQSGTGWLRLSVLSILWSRRMVRSALLLFGAISAVAILSGPARAQSPGHRPPPGFAPPPCPAVTPGPFAGAARGAAGGALFGAIGGNAGRGAAIGAAVGGVAGAARRGAARASGSCY